MADVSMPRVNSVASKPRPLINSIISRGPEVMSKIRVEVVTITLKLVIDSFSILVGIRFDLIDCGNP